MSTKTILIKAQVPKDFLNLLSLSIWRGYPANPHTDRVEQLQIIPQSAEPVAWRPIGDGITTNKFYTDFPIPARVKNVEYVYTHPIASGEQAAATVEVVDSKELLYYFHAKTLLPVGTHDLFLRPQPVVQPIGEAVAEVLTNPGNLAASIQAIKSNKQLPIGTKLFMRPITDGSGREETEKLRERLALENAFRVIALREALNKFRQAFIIAVGDKSPFAKMALSELDAALIATPPQSGAQS